jgi:xanthine dehydrogenase YagS FAD-binding subunit
MKSFEWTNASSIDEAQSLQEKGSCIKAGGVDLLDLMKEHLFEPKRLVNIRNIKGLDKIEEKDGGLVIGPLATLAQIAEHPVIKQKYTALAEACGHAATPQIRNMATVGGNLLQRPRCWYFRNESFHCRKKGGEICYAQEGENQYHAIFNNRLCAIVHPSAAACALVALGATIMVKGGKEPQEVKLEEFFILPSDDLHRENKIETGELITEIRVPAPRGKSFYIKEMEKQSFDWPIAEVVAVIEKDGDTVKSASIILGAAAPAPHRAKETEDALVGKKLDDATILEAAKASMGKATPLALNQYKVGLFPAVIARAITACA